MSSSHKCLSFLEPSALLSTCCWSKNVLKEKKLRRTMKKEKKEERLNNLKPKIICRTKMAINYRLVSNGAQVICIQKLNRYNTRIGGKTRRLKLMAISNNNKNSCCISSN